MKPYEKHVFICVNARELGNPTGCCSSKGAEGVFTELKAKVKSLGLGTRIRVNRAGCLGQCSMGVTAVVYPEGIWYQNLRLEDVGHIAEDHLGKGIPVKRLMPAEPISDEKS
jgi:(2Fe-2S) ferredoxin